jgi:hypothetical protein
LERFGNRIYKLDQDYVHSRMFNPGTTLSNAHIKRRFDELRKSKDLIKRRNEALSVKNPFREGIRERIIHLATEEDQARDQRRSVIYEVLRRMVEKKLSKS